MSAELQEFALKVASALESYSEKAPHSLYSGAAPFHLSMMKMASALKYKHQYRTKTAFLGTTIGMLAPGLLAAGLAGGAAKKFGPWAQRQSLNMFKPQELVGHGLSGMVNAAKGSTVDAAQALMDSLKRSGPVGEEVLSQLGQQGTASAIKPWQVGLAGALGLGAGQMMSGDKPQMIIA
jgi:hypothetical protein